MFKKVQAVNQLLADAGPAAVQKFAKLKLTGRDIYGYQPQRVFDAMNEIFGSDGWSHTIEEIIVHEKQIIARINVSISNRTSVQFGEHRVMAGDVGSAYKSAVTDGIQKALSLFGIGSKAYRGELKDVFDNKVSQTEINTGFESMIEVAKEQARIGIEEGRAWWRQNLAHIQILSNEERKKLVSVLGSGK